MHAKGWAITAGLGAAAARAGMSMFFMSNFILCVLNCVSGYLTSGLQSHQMRVAILSLPPSISTALA